MTKGGDELGGLEGLCLDDACRTMTLVICLIDRAVRIWLVSHAFVSVFGDNDRK